MSEVNREEFTMTVRCPLGLHTRPATDIARVLQKCKSRVTFTYKKRSVNAKSILSLMMLSVPRNGRIHVVLEGEDAKDIKPKLIDVVEKSEEEVATR